MCQCHSYILRLTSQLFNQSHDVVALSLSLFVCVCVPCGLFLTQFNTKMQSVESTKKVELRNKELSRAISSSSSSSSRTFLLPFFFVLTFSVLQQHTVCVNFERSKRINYETSEGIFC